MFPAAFDYRAPTSLDEALSILAQHGDAAKGRSVYFFLPFFGAGGASVACMPERRA